MKTIIHVLKTTSNKKVKKYLSHFPINKQIEAYGLFWIIVETLAIQSNKWDLDKSKLLDKRDEDTQEMILNHSTKIDKAIEAMIDSGFLIPEDTYYYSAFQRIVIENYRVKKLAEVELKQKVRSQEILIKRLEEKIEFLKNPRPLLKKKHKI